MPDTLDWAALTARQRDALVAERVMGYRLVMVPYSIVQPEPSVEVWYDRTGAIVHVPSPMHVGITNLPMFTADHAAARLVENEIARRGLVEPHIDALIAECKLDYIRFVGFGTEVQCDHSALWTLIRATPEQRCRAALIACGVLPDA